MRSARTSRMRALVWEVVGDDARLGAGQGDRAVAEVVDRHGAQGAGDALAGGQEHVHLARVGRDGDLLGHRDQLVGGLATRRQNRHDAEAGLALLDDPLGGVLDALGVGHGGAAELHDHDLRHERRIDGQGRMRPWPDPYMYGSAGGMRRRNYKVRRPARALPRVTSSAYSRSEPTGRPEARRVTVRLGRPMAQLLGDVQAPWPRLWWWDSWRARLAHARTVGTQGIHIRPTVLRPVPRHA